MSRRNIVYGFLDQGVASLTSLLVLAAAAQSLNPGNLGLFSIGLASVISCVSIIRSITGETLLVRATSIFSRASDDVELKFESRSAIGLGLVLGFIASLILVLIGLIWSEAQKVLLFSALAIIPIVGQDCLRHACIALRRSILLLLGDIMVLLISVTGILTVGRLGFGPASMVLMWGLAAFLAFLTLTLTLKVWPMTLKGFAWLKTAWPSSSAFVVEATLGAVIGYTIVVVLGIVASPAEVAGYRTTMSVFGVTSLVINFLRTAVLRELSPAYLEYPKNVWQLFLYMAGLVVSASLATFLVVVLMPQAWGKAAFGDTWFMITELAGWATINRVAAGLSIVPLVFLRAQGIAWGATKIRLILSVPLLLIAPVASGLAGAPGAFMADAGYYMSMTALLMMLVLRQPQKSVAI